MANFLLCVVLKAAACVPAAVCRSKQDLMMCKAMCIGIAYSSNIGGITTLPGTSPNLIFSEYLNQWVTDFIIYITLGLGIKEENLIQADQPAG